MKIELDIPIEEFNRCDDWEDVESNAMSSFMSIVTDRVAEKLFTYKNRTEPNLITKQKYWHKPTC